ncbi:MAG TPA: hypothetical protein VFT01_08495 [Homoserinimonas sp.]|nr:hypothetical protein [Homoserinimonas sp.]
MKPVSRVGFIAGITVFLVAMGGGVSYALWSAGASTSATVKAATVILGVDGSATAPLSGEYRPGQALAAPVTVTNDGSADLVFTASVESTGGTLPPADVSLWIWKVAAASDCLPTSTAPAEAWSGTLSGLTPGPGEPLASAVSQVLCVQTIASVTQAQQGQNATADLVFTGSNGWQSSGSVAMAPTVFTVPDPVLLPGDAGCSGPSSQKSVTLNWQTVSGATAYRLYFTPAVSPAPTPAYLQVTGTTATITGDNFDTITGSADGTGSVSIRAVVDGWESAGLTRAVYFEPKSTGSNAKLSCSAF